MEFSPLTPELEALESQWRRLPTPGPRSDMRDDVLNGVRQVLRSEGRRNWAWYAAGLAAVLLLWANLSSTASRGGARTPSAHADLNAAVEQIEALVPELSRREAVRQALLLDGGRSLSGGATALAPRSAPPSVDPRSIF